MSVFNSDKNKSNELDNKIGKLIVKTQNSLTVMKKAIAILGLLVVCCFSFSLPVIAQISIGGIPDKTVEAVREDLNSNIELSSFSKRTWPNGCLGLAKEGEICTQALEPGWRIVLSNDKVTWVYRTDDSGRKVREESIRLN